MQYVFKADLTKDAAETLAKKKNEEIFPGKPDYYKVVEMMSVNFLVNSYL